MGYIMDLRRVAGHRTLIMPCACAIVEDGRGRILLQKRADDGKWCLHGGSIEIDESAEEALHREVMEELGVPVVIRRLLGVYSGKNYHHVYPNGDETSCIDIVYVCALGEGKLRLQEEEVTGVKWFAREELPPNLTCNNLQPIADYFAGRG